jgi:hypothetical protein|tara:strand:- start:98 stop:913 length:816 start_codon:yes stop_codon:yes gene_type:complete
MIPFTRENPSIQELMIWKRSELINPRTGRSIKKTGNIFKLLKKKYNKIFTNNYDFLDSLDNKDPVSLNKFWIIKDNEKKFIYEKYEDLVLYKDNNNFIRCIEKESLEYLKAFNITNHPVTFDKIPDEVLNKTKNIEINKELNNNELALKIFKKFENLSIYINQKKFLDLSKDKLIKFNYEIKDFYYENINIENRIKIDNSDGNLILKKTNNNLSDLDLLETQKYLLQEIQKLLMCEDDGLKYMINYIIVGALSLVIPEIKENYPDFCFAFN